MAPVPPRARGDDLYHILGVARTAEDADIAKAYKRLALRHHPDKNPEDRQRAEERFKDISRAYSVLGEAQKRRAYDRAELGAGRPLGASRGAAAAGGGRADDGTEALFRAVFGSAPRPKKSPCPFAPPEREAASSGAAQGGGGGAGPMAAAAEGTPQGRRCGGPGEAPWPAHALPLGAIVVIRGLEQAPEHNGKAGRIEGFDPARGRYDVALGGGSALSLRPQRLTQQCEAELTGLEDKQLLNGRVGDIVNYDEQSGRYLVLLQSPAVAIKAQRGNCVLKAGTRVTLCGLSEERYNGWMAQILAVHRGAERYTVRCQSGEEIKIRFEKVVC